MKFMNAKLFFCIILFLFLFACSEPKESQEIYLSGKINSDAIPSGTEGPVFVAMTNTDDFDKILDNYEDTIIEVVSAAADNTFYADLSKKGVSSGDIIYIFAFIDESYTSGLPEPTVGDFVGVYATIENLSLSYRLKEGINDGITVDINREYFSFEASVSGKVNGINDTDAGDLYLVAYDADKVTAIDISILEIEGILGFKIIRNVSPNNWPLSYQLDIFPYLPYGYCKYINGQYFIEDVSIFAFLDSNKNSLFDDGDKIGAHLSENKLPALMTIDDEASLSDIDISFIKDICATSDTVTNTLKLSGTVNIINEANNEYPVYIAVTEHDYMATMADDPIGGLHTFQQINTVEGINQYAFDIDLSATCIMPNDDVLILALSDKDNRGLLPDPTKGDLVGLYINANDLSITHTLKHGNNSGLNINISREMVSLPEDTTISGNIISEKTGDLTIIAYAGELASASSLTGIDFDSVIGFQQIEKPQIGEQPYELDIIPYLPYNNAKLPIENITVYAFLDVNRNGAFDAGDKIGFHSLEEDQGFPTILTIDENGNVCSDTEPENSINIDLVTELVSSSQGGGESETYNVSIKGSFTKPSGYNDPSEPIFLAVLNASNDLGSFFGASDLMSAIRYYKKMPSGGNEFDIDLSDTGLKPGDNVMVVAFWDKDYNGVYPVFNEGDYIGLYQNKSQYILSITLVEGENDIEPSGNWSFDVNRKFYNHNASITFQLWEGDLLSEIPIGPCGPFWNTIIDLEKDDQVILIAVHSGGVLGDSAGNVTIVDIDYIIGYHLITVAADKNKEYNMPLLQIISEDIPVMKSITNNSEEKEFDIDNVYLFAFLDGKTIASPNGIPNGWPDSYEFVGYYWQTLIPGTLGLGPYIPRLIHNIKDGEKSLIVDDPVYHRGRVRFSCMTMP